MIEFLPLQLSHRIFFFKINLNEIKLKKIRLRIGVLVLYLDDQLPLKLSVYSKF
jgi:hypothetical protein